MINYRNLERALEKFKGAAPFDHCVIDDFWEIDVADRLEEEVPDYNSPNWYVYDNALENKKALNNWNLFPSLTYKAFSELNSYRLRKLLSERVEVFLHEDAGLHGGGWHIHGAGGNLNPHLDYSVHPKLKLQRKLNIIIYISKSLDPSSHGGHLGLWAGDPSTKELKELRVEIEPKFNRAVLFDTTQNSWHGMSRPLTTEATVFRKSLAVYYLCAPPEDVDPRGRALYAPRENQKKNPEIEELIRLRASEQSHASVYVKK